MKHKYVVLDEEGVPLRWFWTPAEAEAFCLPGYTIVRRDVPAKPSVTDYLNELGEGRF